MKEPAQSPFAAMSPREQKEQWICWQAAREAQLDVPEELPDLSLPVSQAKPVIAAPPIRHSQYDAVINRMKTARQLAQGDQRWE